MTSTVETGLEWISRVLLAAAAFFALPALALLIATDVSMRYLLNDPIIGAVEGSGLLLLLTFTFALSWTTVRGHHIRMDLVYLAVPQAVRMIIDLLSMVCGLIFFGAVAYQSWHDIEYSRMISEQTAELSLPLWPFYTAILIVFSIISLQLVISTILRMIKPASAPKLSEIPSGAE